MLQRATNRLLSSHSRIVLGSISTAGRIHERIITPTMISEKSSAIMPKKLHDSKMSMSSKVSSSLEGKPLVNDMPKRSLKGSSNKADGRAKAMGVGALASLLQGESQSKASSSKTTSKGVKTESSVANKMKRERSPETDATAADEVEARGKLLRLANQAISTSKTGFSLEQMKEEQEEKKADKEAKKQQAALKVANEPSRSLGDSASIAINPPGSEDDPVVVEKVPTGKDTALRKELRDMVSGLTRYDRESQKVPGNYLAIDCEMVGLGHNGQESCLARVSIVNYHGYIVLDTFVRPRERVTDWRTWVSGVRPKDMNNARHFEDVQAEVAKLLDGKIVIGHAVENDTKALLLSHPSPLLRDTQRNTALRQLAKTKMPGLKKLTELELGLKIQSGAHSSVTDARATMALYRLHKAEWEQAMWKETQAFLARQKKGSIPVNTTQGGRNGHREPRAEDSKKRKSPADDDTAPAKRVRKAGDSGTSANKTAPGNWWEA